MAKAFITFAAALLTCLAVMATPAFAKIDIKVGAYHFPPFYHAKTGAGVSADLIAFLNKAQSDYRFTLVPTSPRRRYADMDRGRFHVMMFEMPEWGWQSHPVDTTPLLLTGGEVYVARAAASRNQGFFDDVTKRKLIAMAGYHYGFAGFNSDAEFLRSRFDIRLTPTHEGNLISILAGRRDIAIVTKAFLRQWRRQNPDDYAKLLISEKLDQEYRLPILVGSASPLSASDLWKIVTKTENEGALRKFFTQRGLRELVAF
ncbi:MAG: substrate-binding periplasmic protein [Geminicoccaceae bacterium]